MPRSSGSRKSVSRSSKAGNRTRAGASKSQSKRRSARSDARRSNNGKTVPAGKRTSVKSSRKADVREPVKEGSSRRPARSGSRGDVGGRRAGDIRKEQREKRQRRQYLKYLVRIAAVIALVLAIVFGSIFIYRSDLFHVNNVQVNGSSHLTSQEITSIAAVSDDSTLLRLDAKGIKERLEDNPWVQEASVHRVFPDTVEIDIVEREPGAVAKINDKTNWVISTDGAWLSAATTDDWENAMKIIDVSPSMPAPISGSICTDGGIMNALDILNNISDDLRSRIVSISAESSIKTSLNLEDGVTVAFGDSSDIEVKEAVINSLLDEYSGKISYINVRVPTRPTYRMLDDQ